MKFADFHSAFDFVKKSTNYELALPDKKRHPFKLKPITNLLAVLGNPQNHFRSIHIAGTKGKGTTAITLAQILKECGYKVGLFTSPHLISILERIKINGEKITQREFVWAINRMRLHIEKFNPTFFDIITAMAFLIFKNRAVKFAVIETGLGGRLDSTNVLKPALTIITRIDYDHVQVLGNKLAEIAFEKSGIIKAGVPVIIASNPDTAKRVIKNRARYLNAPVFESQKDFYYCIKGRKMIRFDYADNRLAIKNIKTKLYGCHFVENMALAIKAVNLLLEYTPQKKIKNALNNLHLPARAEVISHKPVRIIDGAHTPLSISMVVDTIKSNFAYKKALLVFGANIDKEIKKMLKILLPRFNIAIFTKANTPRAASPEYIIKIAKNMRRETICHTTENVPEAIKKAEGILQKNNLLLITGSFYVAGDAIKYYKETGSYEAEI